VAVLWSKRTDAVLPTSQTQKLCSISTATLFSSYRRTSAPLLRYIDMLEIERGGCVEDDDDDDDSGDKPFPAAAVAASTALTCSSTARSERRSQASVAASARSATLCHPT
jgi:hypothetical protein